MVYIVARSKRDGGGNGKGDGDGVFGNDKGDGGKESVGYECSTWSWKGTQDWA
jgi:hypothetical protein